VTENQMLRHFESEKIHITALIVADYSFECSHWNAVKSLSEWLIEHRIPALYDVDTRALTKHLREKGAMLGKILMGDSIDFYDPNLENPVAKVSTPRRIEYGIGNFKVMLVDCGVKNNIIRHLLKRNTTVIRVPWDYDFVKEEFDGLFISNGPGDPKMCGTTINNIAQMLTKVKPVFGICLGNQLLSLAAGGDTYKLKYGHRSHNQPVLQTGTNRCYITSQNHGFATRNESLDDHWEPLFVNANDGTNEGIRHKTRPFFSAQFHPEASSGPTDTDFLFDQFIEMIQLYK
jgi:carbamoyl-phosphate synthase small subunit